jgi:hypothetical protein
MTGLPSKYAKMGFKRGWAAYNSSKKRTRKTKSTKQVVNMARRRKGGFRKFYRKVKSGFTMGNITKIIIGSTLAALYELYLSPMIPIGGMIKNLVELGLGIFLASGHFPMPVKAFGMALSVINAYSLVMTYLPSGGSSSSNQTDW